jgi:hypothetical protein
MFSFEFWITADRCERLSLTARTREIARQTIIGRFAPIFIRSI